MLLEVTALLLLQLLCIVIRALYIISNPQPLRPAGPVKTMIVLGSGGHTAEMLMLVEGMDKKFYTPRVYVAAETDKMSSNRALSREQTWAGAQDTPAGVSIEVIPRSREVGQSYITSVFTTLYSLLFAARMVLRHRPQLVLVNGPGTCIPVCAMAFVNRLLLLSDCRILYVESIARVRKLSLSGYLLYFSRMCDQFFVQWPELQARFPRSMYAGRLY
eukprot:GHRQ01008039.1.p1 GENE.GHRQ01008039.1~~GHRQ01008039.1.p1  ORF type:complete len:217 (+),score=68.08 GHRQ01008039.1:334-984(+)